MSQQPAHQHQYDQMRSVQEALGIAPAPGLLGAEAKFTRIVSRNPAKSDRNFSGPVFHWSIFRFPQFRVFGLPDFQNRIRNRLPVSIQNSPTNRNSPSFHIALNIFPAQLPKTN